MNPLEIFSVILPIIEEIPTVEASVGAIIKAVEGMISGGLSPADILKDVLNMIPAIASAVTANTPAAPAPAPTATAQ